MSVSLVASYNSFGNPRLLYQSYQHYGQAIELLQKAMLSEETIVADTTLAAVILLSTYMVCLTR